MSGRVRDDMHAVRCIKRAALVPREGSRLELQVVDAIPHDARFVLIGEASHGTHEFYDMRAEITKTLIQERGFNAVAVEADFPDAFRANMYARGLSEDPSAEEALGDFIRFPTWMWRNTVVRDFLEWMKDHNEGIPEGGAAPEKVGFYGMDLYSLHSSAKRVLDFLQGVDAEAAQRAAARYHCFDRYGEDAMAYAYATAFSSKASCADAAVATLREVLERSAVHAEIADGEVGHERAFQAACNAAVVAGAEEYYRNMFFGDELTWNLRDTHFADTIGRLVAHIDSRMARAAGGPRSLRAKIVVWAHNSHLGDASATDMGQRRGEINLGQLMRQRWGVNEVYNIGFTTHTGTVAAADEWDSPGQRKTVRKSMPGSYENLFHRAELPEFALNLRDAKRELHEALEGPMLERAIGVIYRPRTERQSHYFYSQLPEQFDAMIHVDHTIAVQPLEPGHPSWEEEHIAKEDVAETYPFGV